MKNVFFSRLLLVLLFSVSGFALCADDPKDNAMKKSRQAALKKVDEAEEKGRPKTAIEALDPILASAKAEGYYAEAVKALVRKITLEGQIEGRKAEEKIARLEAEIPGWPKDSQPILETVLAHWYWQFFQQNRWRFLERTQTAEAPGKDILSWDLSRILAEIDKHFTTALASKAVLQTVPIADYDDLLEKGALPDSYRPTLYDFIAHEALSFYFAGEQAGSKAQDSFDFSADTPAFGTIDEFLAWNPATTDLDSPKLKAIRLLQSLLAANKGDKDQDAYRDADLARIKFAMNAAYGPDKDERATLALEAFAKTWADHPISTRARADWANLVRNEGDLVRAHQIAKQGADAFPNTLEGNQCHNLIAEIEAKQSSLTTERVWNAPWPKLQLRYKNVSEAHFRIYPYVWEDLLNDNHWSVEHLAEEDAKKLLKTKAAAEWSVTLPVTADYQEREESIDVPKDLKAGFYFVFASHDQDFTREKENRTSSAAVWVSDLALVTRIQLWDGEVGGFVLNAITGEPLAGAEVKGWKQGQNNQRIALQPVKTDANGLFRFPGVEEGIIIKASHGGHHVTTLHDVSNFSHQQEFHDQHITYFFTDRSLYRPGQTISYKGLSVKVNPEKDNYQVEKNLAVEVVFSDVNGQEISRQNHQTNEFGSFHGSFTAPRDRLMGQMMISTNGNTQGNTSINVEEYKRPKFKVTLDAPTDAPRVEGAVELVGTATTYSGAAVDGAKVKYRVVREVRYPSWWHWCFWWLPPHQGDSQEIEHGETKTGVDGKFKLTFTALPDRSVPAEDEPSFYYTIHADVTDPAGETRSSSRTVTVGYTALQASLSANDWQVKNEPVKIDLSTLTLDGEGQVAQGTIKVHRLDEPKTVQRGVLTSHSPWYPGWVFVNGKRERPTPKPDLSNPNSWALADVVATTEFTTNEAGKAELTFNLAPGIYRAMLETKDKFGKAVTARLPLQILDPAAATFPLVIPNLVAAPRWTVEPGEEFKAIWGTGYQAGRAYIEIEHRGKNLQAYWTVPGKTQTLFTLPVEDTMRGGFTLRVTQVRENRAYITQRTVSVPWSNKKLEIKWSHHTSKLEPGQKETWTATVSGPNAEKAVAEIAAALYDESLDAYLPHRWMSAFDVFRHDHSRMSSHFQNQIRGFDGLSGFWSSDMKPVDLRYRSFPEFIKGQDMGGIHPMTGRSTMMKRGAPMAGMPAMEMAADAVESPAPVPAAPAGLGAAKNGGTPPTPAPAPAPNLDNVSARTNLQETAFFFPNLISKPDGSVDLEFTMPEALTTWKFFAFAHDADLRSGFLSDSVITQKDIMVQPNPPRFLREGDQLEFTVKVINLSDIPQSGTVRLTFDELNRVQSAIEQGTIDQKLGLTETDQAFAIPGKESRTFSWKLSVPDGQGFLSYKAVASTGKLSDGETGFLPVLPRRILVTESMPLPIRDAGSREFSFTKFLESGKSDSLQNESLTVQMASNPSWYAVMALPYLMEYPHQCSEQIFNRLYANSLARHIGNSNPKIKQVFEQWRGTPALDSPLEKNEDLKSIVLEETPWVRQARKENESRQNVGILFDDNRIEAELKNAQKQLAERQSGDGSWSWFPGGPGNDYITLYITNGFGRLRHLGVEGLDMEPAFKSLNRLDAWIKKRYEDIVKQKLEKSENLDPTVALYLYCRSFFLEDKPIAAENQVAINYFLEQASKHWLKLSRQSQGHIALALHRFDVHKHTPSDIVISLRENAKNEEEMGMYWRDTEYSYWWYRAPVETQALMIEVFDEVAGDQRAVEDLKVWMLKQKQTQDWKTTKATADAVYALLLRGSDLLASQEMVRVSLGGKVITPEKVEAGTGFYEQKLIRTEIQPDYGKVTVTKADPGVAWGSLHWQYFESMEKITPHEGTPLTLTKKLYIKENTAKGPVLTELKTGGTIKVGNEVVVRLELRTDRDMEYLHLKDQRGAGTEPINVLSTYKYQDGLGYYESTRDTASHFFIDYLPKGTYVFEYSIRVQHRGNYQSGMASIQCMYSPEFNSHSGSAVMEVKE